MIFFLTALSLGASALQSLCGAPLAEQFKQVGYAEIYDGKQSCDSLYADFDQCIEFLQAHPEWKHKLYHAKERFIRSKDRSFYSTDVFGFYEERSQISFYYSTHFHAFICSRYPEFNQAPEIMRFLEACDEIQKSCGDVCEKVAAEFGLDISILLKVVKYLPSYSTTRPHYDGSAFSLFLDSTANESLCLSSYKPAYTVADFSSPLREANSILLIPGVLLTEFSIFPSPHIVAHSGKVRYATIAFAMRPHYTPPKTRYSPLPSFVIE